MRPADISTEQIIEAGEQLRAAGRRNITGFALRQKIGRGNPARMRLVWNEHAAGQGTAPAAPAPELPPEIADRVAAHGRELADRLATLAAELNADAIGAAERRVTSVLAESAAQRELAEGELCDAAATVEDLETQLDLANAAGEELKVHLADAQLAHQAQAVEFATVRERLALTEQAAAKAEQDHADEMARLHAATDAERTRYQVEQEEAKKAIQAAATERDQARGELATVKAKVEAREEQRKLGAAAEAHRLAERLTKTQGERDQASSAAAAAREEAARLRGKVEAMQAQIENLTRALAAQTKGEEK